MSALPASALNDVAPIHGALYELPAAADPVRLLDRRPSAADEPTVPRQALFERLAEAGAVIIVSAPAASGQTCLLRALDALRPVIECSSPSVYPGPSAIEALLLAAAAHAELGDVRAAGDSIERAPA